MDIKIRQAQENILKIFAKATHSFALAGGTALELYYLHHRFSADLDFFSPDYSIKEIERLVSEFKEASKSRVRLESEFITEGKARVRFYTMSLQGSSRPLKIDFVEDTLFAKPSIKRFQGVPVYNAKNIYLQKISAITGTRIEEDEIGRQIIEGRRQARDVFDIYMFSKKIQPLHTFLKGLSSQMQRGIMHWYQTFSRQELKLALLDLDIYDKKFDAKEMILYLEDEIKKFMRQVLDES